MHDRRYTENCHVEMEAQTRVIQLQECWELLATNANCKGQGEILCCSLAKLYISVLQRLQAFLFFF